MQDKKKCKRYWERHELDIYADEIIEWSLAMKETERWTKDGGRYQPLPYTILNNERWNDPVPDPLPPSSSVVDSDLLAQDRALRAYWGRD
jgi:hypothetical protein